MFPDEALCVSWADGRGRYVGADPLFGDL